MDIITFEDAGFSYDGCTFVFRGINLRVDKGQFVGIVGCNGSGKSTLVKHINALLVPDEGSVYTNGQDTSNRDLTYSIRSEVGFVFQNPDDQLVSSLVENDVAFGPENLGVEDTYLPQRVRDSLEKVDLAGCEKTEVSALSGGQKQRLAIAGALAMNPTILILDEASAMLDPIGRSELINTVCALHNKGMTIVMITHIMEEAAIADRVVVMDEGMIRMDGTPHEVLTNVSALAECHLDIPFACRMSIDLQKHGINIPCCLTIDELEEELCALRLNR